MGENGRPLTDMLSTGQTADKLGVSVSRVRQLVDEGKLHPEQTPLGNLFDPDEISRMVAHRAKHGPPADKAVRGPKESK